MSGDRVSVDQPLVTLGVPVRNGAGMLRAALDSIVAQDYPNIEILVSDNASDDATPEILAEYAAKHSNMRIVRQQKPLPAFDNFLFVMREAKGEFLAWCAHDDTRSPDFISKLLPAFRDPKTVLAFGDLYVWDGMGEPLQRNDYHFTNEGLSLWRRLRKTAHMQCYHIYGLWRVSALRAIRYHATYWWPDMPIMLAASASGTFRHVKGPRFNYFEVAKSDAERAAYQDYRQHISSAHGLAALLVATCATLTRSGRALSGILARSFFSEIRQIFSALCREPLVADDGVRWTRDQLMTTVLLTGASGFVGRWAFDALNRNGCDVHGISRQQATDGDIVMHDVDLHDTAAASLLIDKVQPTHLLLSAWTTAHGSFWTDPANETWVKSSFELVDHFLKRGGRRIVLASTCAEYDWSDPVLEAGPVTETEAQGTPQTLYGQSKRRAADTIANLAGHAGASFAAGRIFFPMGWAESRERFLPTIVNAMLDARPAYLGSGKQIRDVMDVRDVGAALAALVMCDVEGPVNSGSGKGAPLADVARLAGAFGGRPDLLQFGMLPARAGDPPRLVADIRRLRDEVGFAPRYTLDDTIASAFDYWAQLKLEAAKQAVTASL